MRKTRRQKSSEQKGKSNWNPILPRYGQYWRRDCVDWRGRRGRKRDVGLLPGKIGTRVVDFADQIGVYVLYDEDHVPIYVGQAGRRNKNSKDGVTTNRLFGRLRSHALGLYGERWKYFSWFGLRLENQNKKSLRQFKSRAAKVTQILDGLEAAMIAASDPRLNSQSGHLSGATKVEQYVPDRLKRSVSNKLDDIEGLVRLILAASQGAGAVKSSSK